MFHIVAESIKKAGFFYEEKYNMPAVISEKNASLAAADTQMEIMRKIAERFFQNTVGAVLTACKNVLQNYDPLAWSKRTIENFGEFFQPSGPGKVNQPVQGEIKQKLIFGYFLKAASKGFLSL